MEISPTANIMIDNTAAKMGLSTKKREKFMAILLRGGSATHRDMSFPLKLPDRLSR